jgi:hypothetical protein
MTRLSECASWTLFATALSLSAPAANADTLKEKIVGTWSAVSQYVDQNGNRLEPFGPDPKGMVIYEHHGPFHADASAFQSAEVPVEQQADGHT